MKISPRSCRLKMAYEVATPARSATSAPFARDGMAPCHGSQLAKMWFMMPVPLVSVMNCDRNPIRPARRNPELQPHAPAAVVHHLGHHALALAHLRDDDALVILRDVDHQLLDRLDDCRRSAW